MIDDGWNWMGFGMGGIGMWLTTLVMVLAVAALFKYLRK